MAQRRRTHFATPTRGQQDPLESRALFTTVIGKSDGEEVRVRVVAYRGRRFVDIRLFQLAGRHQQGPVPTKRGLTLSCQSLDEFLQAVLKVQAFALEKRLIRR